MAEMNECHTCEDFRGLPLAGHEEHKFYQPARAPPDEEARVKALLNLGVLDTPAEERFDELTRLASEICDVPISLVSLVDPKRQWFKSHHGLDATETPREMAFCAHAILDPVEPFVVEDSHKDCRFRDNPLVTGAPHVRFYAGVPLTLKSGHSVGTLCAIDNKPRRLSDKKVSTLRTLGRQVVAQLELEMRVREQEEQLRREREVNEELRAARTKAEEAANAKERFLANVSHELRTPLNSILGFAELLEDELHDASEASRTFVKNIRFGGDRLLDVINSVLQLSKIKAGQVSVVHDHETDLQSLLSQVVEMHAVVARKRDSHVYATAAAALPESACVDRSHLTQILVNIIGNSVKFDRRGGVFIYGACEAQRPRPRDILRRAEVVRRVRANAGCLGQGGCQGQGSGRTAAPGGDGAIEAEGGRADEPGPDARLRCVVSYDEEASELTGASMCETCQGTGGATAYLVVSIADNGVGIEDRRQEAVFQPFQQANDTTTRVHGGTGLGLSIVRQLVSLLGGDMYLESQLGVGSCFTVVMPVGLASSMAPQTPHALGVCTSTNLGSGACDPSPRRPTTPRPSLAKRLKRPLRFSRKILVAEDDVISQRMLRFYFAKLGIKSQLILAGDGLTAFERAVEERPCVIILDMHMPVLDGVDVFKKLKAYRDPDGNAVFEHHPIWALTADAFIEQRRELLGMGFSGHLAKPLNIETLSKTLAMYEDDAPDDDDPVAGVTYAA